jgi:hypothetical protein
LTRGRIWLSDRAFDRFNLTNPGIGAVLGLGKVDGGGADRAIAGPQPKDNLKKMFVFCTDFYK